VADGGEGKRRIYVDEERGDFVNVMEHQRVPPGDDGRGEGAMGQAVARHKQGWVPGEDPDVGQIEDGYIVTQVK
jgi:hypothetical protein